MVILATGARRNTWHGTRLELGAVPTGQLIDRGALFFFRLSNLWPSNKVNRWNTAKTRIWLYENEVRHGSELDLREYQEMSRIESIRYPN
jgi:hypothetical protein